MEDLLAIIYIWFAQQAEQERVAQLIGAPFDARQHPRGAIIAKPITNDPQGVRAALDQAAGKHVWGIAHFRDDGANLFTRFGRDV